MPYLNMLNLTWTFDFIAWSIGMGTLAIIATLTGMKLANWLTTNYLLLKIIKRGMPHD